MNFNSGNFTLHHVTYYADSKTASTTADFDFSLIQEIFHSSTFDQFSKVFLPGECHVTPESFYAWKEGLGQYEPVIQANFKLTKGNQQYGITQYSMTYNNTKFLVAQAHKEVNGKWYVPALEENIELQSAIRFFSLIRKSFFERWKTNPSLLQQDTLLFENGELKAETLVMDYSDKYRNETVRYAVLNSIFENVANPVEDRQEATFQNLRIYFENSNLPAADLSYVLHLLDALLPLDAIDHVANITARKMDDILMECPNALAR